VVFGVMVREPVITIALSIRPTKKSRKKTREVIAIGTRNYPRMDEFRRAVKKVSIHAIEQRRPSVPIWINLDIASDETYAGGCSISSGHVSRRGKEKGKKIPESLWEALQRTQKRQLFPSAEG
jgi:hypothetical protein